MYFYHYYEIKCYNKIGYCQSQMIHKNKNNIKGNHNFDVRIKKFIKILKNNCTHKR